MSKDSQAAADKPATGGGAASGTKEPVGVPAKGTDSQSRAKPVAKPAAARPAR